MDVVGCFQSQDSDFVLKEKKMFIVEGVTKQFTLMTKSKTRHDSVFFYDRITSNSSKFFDEFKFTSSTLSNS